MLKLDKITCCGAASPVETVFPAALIPLYCRQRTRVSMLHAIEFSGMPLLEAVNSVLTKYPEYWQWKPLE